MPFTDEERRKWHDEKRRREDESHRLPISTRPAVTNCIDCGQPFGLGEGLITEEVSLCYRCNDD